MTSVPSPSSSSFVPAVASKTGRPSKDTKHEEAGRRVEELVNKCHKYATALLPQLYDVLRKHSLEPSIIDSLKIDLVDLFISLTKVDALGEIRIYVSAADTRPIDSKYVGRALSALEAFSEARAVTRIDLFAFFADSPQCEVVKNTEKVDYWACAEECYSFKNKRLKGPRIYANKVSEGLETPVIRLEQLRLALSKTKKVTPAASRSATKRECSYLTPIGIEVFSGWPEWPTP